MNCIQDINIIMWNKPWKYREGFAISIGLLITGALLQVSIGPMEWLVFMWPANIIALAVLIIMLVEKPH